MIPELLSMMEIGLNYFIKSNIAVYIVLGNIKNLHVPQCPTGFGLEDIDIYFPVGVL